ncbi:Peptidase S24-like [Chitinophaga rupis]|uniref:Peptidase S24-like n=1 Tax=Chitinophaga rupis TaxID=573321 RepID=A0A1H7GMC5_9BACT|nr:S24 family peptidase [Chitinophaga rupis]SEK39239.1 Peptidase S24-like [Chitinophaga rupis]
MTLLLGDILKIVRTAIGDTQDELADKLGIVRGTYSSDERKARPGKKHSSIEFYEKYKDVFGIDLYQSVNMQRIVIVDPTKLSWGIIVKLIEVGAFIAVIPIFEILATASTIPLYQDAKHAQPIFSLPIEMYPHAEFGMFVKGNSMEPAIYEGDYVICGPRLTSKDIKNGHVYLVGTDDDENTIKILNLDKKKKLLSLIPTNPEWKKKDIAVEKVRYIHKVIALHRKEEGINKHTKPI